MLPFESTLGLSVVHAAPLEFLSRIEAISEFPWEALRGTIVVLSNAELPFEVLQGIESISVFPWEAPTGNIIFIPIIRSVTSGGVRPIRIAADMDAPILSAEVNRPRIHADEGDVVISAGVTKKRISAH